jgi:hypothetical protein
MKQLCRLLKLQNIISMPTNKIRYIKSEITKWLLYIHSGLTKDNFTLLFVFLTTIGVFWQGFIFKQTMIDTRTANIIQNDAMKYQLDLMENDKRPWIENKVSIVYPIRFTEWNGHKGINIRLKLNLKNHGQTPAINVKTTAYIGPHPGNDKRNEMDNHQKLICNSLKEQSDENHISGIAIFPNEFATIESGSGRYEVYDVDNTVFFIVYGCIDYTYGNARHGETGFRMILGKEGKPFILGIPFVTGIRPVDFGIITRNGVDGYFIRFATIGLINKLPVCPPV